MKAERLLLSEREIEAAIGPRVAVVPGKARGAALAVGEVVRSAAADSAYRYFAGRLIVDDTERPMAVGMMALVFDSSSTAEQTFERVAEAAHMSTRLDGARVAVETVTTANGMVSYWGYVYRDQAIVILTLDTLDPQHLSIADLRSLVKVAADRLQVPAQHS